MGYELCTFNILMEFVLVLTERDDGEFVAIE